MQLFYAPDISGETHTFDETESNHCVRVLRKSAGDTIHIIDGRGNLFTCEITDAHPKHCTVAVRGKESGYGALPYRLHLAVAPTKNIDRYEWMLEKATEIGAESFIPLECTRSERRTVKQERLGKVIVSAAKQSLKAFLPKLEPTCRFEDFVIRDFGRAQLFIGYCAEETERTLLKEALHPGGEYVVLIGPEGDFSPEEIALARRNGFQPISLGNSRLRTETAGVMAAAIAAVINM